MQLQAVSSLSSLTKTPMWMLALIKHRDSQRFTQIDKLLFCFGQKNSCSWESAHTLQQYFFFLIRVVHTQSEETMHTYIGGTLSHNQWVQVQMIDMGGGAFISVQHLTVLIVSDFRLFTTASLPKSSRRHLKLKSESRHSTSNFRILFCLVRLLSVPRSLLFR